MNFKMKTKIISSILGSIALGIALTVAAVSMLLALPAAETSAQGPDTADVVVRYPNEDNAIVRRIHFSGPTPKWYALYLTGLEVITDGLGNVCSIDGIGCPASSCWCSENWWLGEYWNESTDQWDDTYPFPDVVSGTIDGWRYSPVWPGTSIASPGPRFAAASDALEWLRTQQSLENGGYGGSSSTADAILAIGANKLKAAEWRRQADSPSLMHYMLANGATYANTGAGEAGKLAVALAAADGCWPARGMQPTDYYSPTTGAFASQSINQSWAMLGTRALSQSVPATATQYLKNMAQPNGGWEFSPGWGTDTNSTALAIQALVAAGEPVSSSVITKALTYLKSTQNITDGGFPYDPDAGWPGAENSDTDSTAYVVQAILAVGEDPLTGTWTVTNSDPISYLLSMQLPDGSFEWQTGYGSNLKATQDAIPALLNQPFPANVADLRWCDISYLAVIFKN